MPWYSDTTESDVTLQAHTAESNVVTAKLIPVMVIRSVASTLTLLRLKVVL